MARNDFIGINADNIGNLEAALAKYRSSIQEEIAAFNANANIANTMAGDEVEAAVQGYLEEGKTALQEIVEKLQKEETILQQAFEQWISGESGVAGNVDGAAADLRAVAGSFTLE